MSVFLKRLEVHGFKSFADKAVVEFKDGATALLGPNGCGKSNVVDSIKWVLGSQKKSDFRSKSRDGLIFSGTSKRKEMNYAEVALTISNENGVLKNVNAPEIEIKRRIERGGTGNDYFINGEKVRAGDIQELFMDTGIGKSAYSILEQGKIGQIVESSADDRRLVFDEAAGITKYKAEVKEAQRNIEKTEANLENARMLRDQHEKTYNKTKDQAEKVREAKKIKQEKEEIEIKVNISKIKGFKLLSDDLNNQIKNNQSKIEDLEKEISELNNLIASTSNTNTEKTERLQQLTTDIEVIKSKITGIENQIMTIKPLYDEDIEKIKELTDKAKAYEDEISAFDKEIEIKQNRYDQGEEELKDKESERDSNITKKDDAKKGIISNREEISLIEENLVKWEEIVENYNDKMAAIANKIVEQIDANLKDSGYSSEQRTKLEKEVIKDLKDLSSNIIEKLNYIEKNKKDPKLADDYEKYLESLLEKIDDIKGNFQEYSGSIPLFFDELISQDGIITEKRKLEDSLGPTKANIKKGKEKIDFLKKEISNFETLIEQLEDIIEDIIDDINERKIELVNIQGEIESVKNSKEGKQIYLDELKQRIGELSEKIEKRIEEVNKLGQERAELTSRIEENEVEQQQLYNEVGATNAKVAEHRAKVDQDNELLTQTKVTLSGIEGRLEAVSPAIDEVYRDFFDTYGKPLTDYDYLLEEDLEEYNIYHKRLIILNDMMKKFGNLNYAAEQEFKEAEEQFLFYQNTITDLEKALEDLQEVHTSIVEESTRMFLESFEKVRESYKYMFDKMFGTGSEADIILEDPDDVLGSGITIIANPPGKKVKQLSQLSGGEKSMTGVAVIFGIYRIKASPFCILDEVDAALDDVNVGRFLNGLHEFKDSSQFIVITHNKHTASKIEHMLGVSMQEPGVTTFVTYVADSIEGQQTHVRS